MTTVRVDLEGNRVEGAELEQVVHQDIQDFERWFVRDGRNDPLVRSEVAILKTYLYFKLKEQPAKQTAP